LNMHSSAKHNVYARGRGRWGCEGKPDCKESLERVSSVSQGAFRRDGGI
jgi:hypothetical protein